MNAPKSTFTHLHIAARQGDAELVKRLLEQGIDPTSKTHLGWTPLHFAARHGHPDCCRLLLEAGVPIDDVVKVRGFMPIHFAALYGHTKVVDFLRSSGADINATTCEGWTVIHAAVEHAQVSTLKFLADQGLTLNRTRYLLEQIKGGSGISPTVAQLLQDRDTSVEPDVLRDAQLRWAVAAGNCEEAEKQLRNGADPNMPKRLCGAVFPLGQAVAYNDDIAMAQLLIHYGAKVNRREMGSSLLYYAVHNGNFDMVKLLVTSGAKPGKKQTLGEDPLQESLRKGRRDIADYLIEHGARILYKGITPASQCKDGRDCTRTFGTRRQYLHAFPRQTTSNQYDV